MAQALKGSGDTFLLVSAILSFLLIVVGTLVGTAFLIQALFGPATRPWKLTFWEGVISIPVILAALCVGLVLWIPLWTLFVRPFAPRREFRASLIGPGIFFFSWYCKRIADWLVPESRDEGGTRN
jgi:hypothetical protein